MKLTRFSLVLLVFGLAVSGAAAQTGSLKVVVFDENGQPLPAATVTLSNDRGYVKESGSLTDARGVAMFPVLRAGAGYLINVSFPGMAPVRKGDLKVPLGGELVETIQLAPELVEQVRVVAEREVVDLDKPEATTKFSDEFIQDLPVPGRFYQNVLTMAPGVSDDDGDGNPTVHGSRARDFKTSVGGVSNVDPLTGQMMSQVNPNSIEEMEVVTAGAGVEYGRAQGGYARIIQKQGSNEFEGLFELIYRSDKLDGNGATDLTGEDIPKFSWYQPSVQFSGPLVKDKLWYRLSHELIAREDPVDTGRAIEVRTVDQQINSDQLTWQVSPRNKLAFLFESDPLTVENVDISSLVPSESSRKFDIGGQKMSLTWTAPYSPKLLVETIAAYQDFQVDILPMVENSPNECFGDQDMPALVAARCFDIIDGSFSGSYNRIHEDHRQRLSLLSEATIYGGRFWGMNHEFKFGVSVENERYYRDLTQNPFLQRFYQIENEEGEGGEGDLTKTEIYLARITAPRTSSARATGTIWGFYARDQIKPLQNLTITIGARIDREATDSTGAVPFDAEGELATFLESTQGLGIDERKLIFRNIFTGYDDILGIINSVSDQLGETVSPFDIWSDCQYCPQNTLQYRKRQIGDINLRNTNVSPGLSISWDPWSNGKTKLSLAVGRHYNNIPLGIPLIEQDPATVDMEMLCYQGECSRSGGSNIRPNVQVVERDLATPYQDELFLSFERELWTESSLRVSYLSRKYRDQFQDIDINHAPGDYGRCQVQSSPDQATVVPITDPSDPLYGMYPLGGDGIIDDCVGELFFPEDPPEGGSPLEIGLGAALQRPDGTPDLYVQNAIWGDIFLVGNYNQADYDAYIVEFTRRQYRGWEMTGSYVWSKALGDGEDFAQALGDDRTLLEDEKGYQSNDRRHEVKVNATTITPWGFRLGTSVAWVSGLPYSILERRISRDALPPFTEGTGSSVARPRISYTTGTRNDHRNESYWNVDVKLTKEMNLPHGMNLQVSMEIYNLLNDGTYMIYNPGIEAGQQVNGVNDSISRFGRRFQLGGKLSF